MSPTNRNTSAPLLGLPALEASLPLAQAPRGGVDSGFDGTTVSPNRSTAVENVPPESDPLARMGPLLEASDEQAFSTIHNLWLRQERLARNRLACDIHWTRVVLGYPFGRLEKVDNQDVWRSVLPPGSDRTTMAAVPNKAADLCNKIVETIMVDPPQAAPSPATDSETAERAAEMLGRFLDEDGGESGTNDTAQFWQALQASITRASAFLHLWVDTTGGGSVPLQIKAHPLATDPANPLLGPDGMPTPDPILRYVTAPEGGQFVDDPSQAAPQWLPRIRVDQWGREHVRCYPETADIATCEQVVAAYYTTLGEAKRRWPTIAQMDDDTLSELCDWTPPRYLSLLPAALRARWKLATGDPKDTKGGANDERVMFYYLNYRRPTPAETQGYPRGAMIVCSGAFGGFVIARDTWSAEIDLPEQANGATGTEIRCLDIPIAQVRPVIDADERDPTGVAMMSRIGGPNEASATLATSYLEAIDLILHPASFIPATSPVQSAQIASSRASGVPVPILSKDDQPFYEEIRPLPATFATTLSEQYSMMDSIMGVNRPVQGSDNQQEVSGVARNIAVQQGLVALSRVRDAVMSAYERYWRVKGQLAMKYFSVPQQLRYVGEDGSYKQEWWTGADLAQTSDVGIKPGTGTMMTPQAKQQYIQVAQSNGWIPPDEAQDAARPTFAEALGLPEDPFVQRVERQVALFDQGPPKGWLEAHQQAASAQQTPPVPGQPVPPAPPQFTPFIPMANDTEPTIAALRKRRLSKLLVTARFSAQPAPWQELAIAEYTRMRQAVAQAASPPPAPAAKTPMDASWQQVIQAVTGQVVSKMEALVATEVARLGGVAPVPQPGVPQP